MAKNKTKYYVVWEGRIPGIYSTWTECQKQTQGYPQAKFKSYENEQEARAALKEDGKNPWISLGRLNQPLLLLQKRLPK